MANTEKRKIRHRRIRKKISGNAERPRLSVHFSGRHIQAQVIDDVAGVTVASVHTTESNFRGAQKVSANVETAQLVGRMIAERGRQKNVQKVVFDRGGYKYHGKVKALADAAREAGFEF